MPRYFTHLDRTNAPSNALQRAAARVLEDASNRIAEDLDKFLADLKSKIGRLNADHPRCAPLDFSTYGLSSDSIGIYLGGHFTIGFYAYRIKEVPHA